MDGILRNHAFQQSDLYRSNSFSVMDLIILRNLGYNLQPTNIPKEWLLYNDKKYYKVFKAKDFTEAILKVEELIKKQG